MGGTGQNGIDCSAFTQKMFKEKFDYALSRSTLTQVNEGIEVKKSELQPGDLVFFKTSKIDKHVGVYTGNGEFLHASIKGIQYTKLDKPFYKDSYWTARRVIN
jgi:murein DD-endopeptidase / murein LD-carboxypeptidase